MQLINEKMVYSITERKFILEIYLKTKSHKIAINFNIYCNLFFQTLVI
jgi:hypothetical protein